MEPVHFAGVVALQRSCFPEPFPEDQLWTLEHLENHHRQFAEGQFVILGPGQEVVASASGALIDEANWMSGQSWEITLGGFNLSRHTPDGTTYYAADISCSPLHRNRGLAKSLYEARKDLVRRLGRARLGTACRLPGFQTSGLSSLDHYVHDVLVGNRKDPTLSPLLKLGMNLVGVLHDYMEDEESGHAAAKLQWLP